MNISDREAFEAVKKLKQYCANHPDCRGCPFEDSGIAFGDDHCEIEAPRSWKKIDRNFTQSEPESESYGLFDVLSDQIDDWFFGEEY